MINWIENNALLSHFIILITGVLGFFIFKKIRPEFYENKPILWWVIVFILYFLLIGPILLLSSLVALFFDKILKK